MEQFNKALSFILGLVVVAVFIIVASGKFNFKGFGLPKTKTSTAVSPTPTGGPKPTSKPWFFGFNQPTPKPTSKPAPKPTAIPKMTWTAANNNGASKGGVQQQVPQDPNYHSYFNNNAPASIPNTGVPVVLFPLLGSSLITGIFIRNTGKKKD